MHSGCLLLTGRGVVKEGLFYFLLHFPFFFLLIFLFLCCTAVFHVAVKVSVLVSRVSTFEWKRRWVWEALSSGIPKGGAGFAFPLPQPCSGMCLRVCLWDGSRYPAGNPLTVCRQEQCSAGLTCHAAFQALPAILPQAQHVGPRLYCNQQGILLKL